MPCRRVSCVLVVVLVAAFASAAVAAPPARVGYSPAPGSRAWPIDGHLSRFSPSADSAWRRAPEAGIAFADSVLRVARAEGNRVLEAAAHVWRGRKLANHFRLEEAAPDLDAAWGLALALGDSAGLTRVLIARGHGASVLGRMEDSRREFTRALPLARAAGLPGLVGFAHRGLGYAAKMDGRYEEADRQLRAALRLLPPERFESRHTRFLLAEVVNRAGDPDGAREMFIEVLAEARRRSDRWLEAAAFNDLGNLEYEGGDMALADRYWTFAAGVFDSTGNAPSAVNARINRALAMRQLGRWDESRALLERLLEDSRDLGDPGPRIAVYGELGHLYRRMGRPAQAEKMLRAVRAAATDDALEQGSVSIELADLLRETGRAHAAEVLLDSLLVPARRDRLTRDHLAAARASRSAALRAQGRPRDALADARAAEEIARTAREQVSLHALEAALELARCHRDLGGADSAVIVLQRAAAGWELWRSSISDLEWRERSGAGLAAMFTEYGLALLDSRRGMTEARRAREAFDALQAFQARTLEERMHGRGLAGRVMRHRITADSLRRGVLRDGELLIDVVATPDTSFAFILTRAGLEVRLLPGTRRLDRLHDDWRAATLAGAAGTVVESGLARMSRELLGPLAEAIRASDRLIVTGGGPLALWPLAALTLPGETAPLCERREIFTAPSATLFALLRGEGETARPDRGLLALGRTTDAGGRGLPGAERELRSLGARFAGTVVRMNSGGVPLSELTADLGRWSVLHFAAHAEADAGSPWRSGFLLGRGHAEDAYLRASGVAGMRLSARLAVLSGCESAGATTLAGEGALGLASAFLCSGTSSVVATLWPVEDRVAALFVAEFYSALYRGRSVAGAVAEAQRVLRARPDTANPRAWAAFIASGEAGIRVPLVAKGRRGDGR
jgi:CHAT domain-containing protein/tetratricopeptide (TPR) repeat protein